MLYYSTVNNEYGNNCLNCDKSTFGVMHLYTVLFGHRNGVRGKARVILPREVEVWPPTT